MADHSISSSSMHAAHHGAALQQLSTNPSSHVPVVPHAVDVAARRFLLTGTAGACMLVGGRRHRSLHRRPATRCNRSVLAPISQHASLVAFAYLGSLPATGRAPRSAVHRLCPTSLLAGALTFATFLSLQAAAVGRISSMAEDATDRS